MPVIDLEILIPASPEHIWRFLGDIAKAPQWQAGVKAVSFLTTQREGKGARWRYSHKRGADIIIEAAAWYDTVGYEYTVVDGAGLGDNQGRIRLTEVTDGTVVRWTLNYEPAGMLGGLRNAVRYKGKAARQIQASLRNLHQLAQRESGGAASHDSRASVREAPDVEQRQEYKPRHPSALDESLDESTAPREPFEAIEAPQLQDLPAVWRVDMDDGDTKPNPVILGSGAFLDLDLQRGEINDATEPIDSPILNIAPASPKPESAPEPEPELPPPPEPPTAPPDPTPASAIDSSRLSVFEVFGLRKPSEMEDELFDASASLARPMPIAEQDDEPAPAAAAPIEPVAETLDAPSAMEPDEPITEVSPQAAPIALPETAAESVVTPNGGWRKRQRRRALRLRAGH